MRAFMKSSAGVLFCLLALGAAEAPAAPPAKPRDELSVIHVLVVADTDANIGDSAGIDEQNFSSVLSKAVADPKRIDLTRLDGGDAAPQKVLDYYKKLAVGPNEGVVFFYAGHEATAEKDHILVMKAGNLKRQDLMDVLKATNAPLVVCLTDCASLELRGGKAVKKLDALADNPVVLNLFFQARGVVDVTAAAQGDAMGDDTNGGYFTRSLCDCLRDKPENLATPGDGEFVTWAAFFDKVKQATLDVYPRSPIPEKPPGDRQVPFAWSLGLGWRFGVRALNNKGDGVRVGEVFDGTPAKRKGFEVGDVLLKINDTTLVNIEDFTAAIDGSDGRITVVVRDRRTGKQGPISDIALERIGK
jgi:PDZ domain